MKPFVLELEKVNVGGVEMWSACLNYYCAYSTNPWKAIWLAWRSYRRHAAGEGSTKEN